MDAVTRARDGRATVTSRPGHTCFVLRLPARRDDGAFGGGSGEAQMS
ncbi:hypothetical protein [Streptomyces sp. NBC_00233]|nr:hypothetical protein [Streptomyces sp. NBC_00233]MCX5230378.1 hypothetical protein [Streptomyces sp. NBC_00233]